MNYNKNSRKMTARNIVMLIGVVLGIQAGFVSHAMEDNSLLSSKNEIKEDENEIKEQASYLVGVVNGLLKDFNLFIKENNRVKLESFTLDDLNIILEAFNNKSFSKEIFLSDKIYKEFNSEVLNDTNFHFKLSHVLKQLTELVSFFLKEETLQQISKDVKNGKFDEKTVEKLAELTYDVSELHKTFRQTGILAEVDEFNLQNQNNEIKEDENKIIKESYTIDKAEIKLLGEFDKEFTELKQKFDEILKGIGTDENNIKKAVELAFKMFVLIVKQISKKTTKFPVFELSFRNVLNIKFEQIHIYFNKIEKSLEEVNNNEKLKSNLTDSEVQWVNTFIDKMSEIAFVKNKENFVKFDRNTGDIVNLNIYNFKKLIIFFKDIFDSWQKVIESELNQKTK